MNEQGMRSGRVFIHVNGTRFGQEDFGEEIGPFFSRALREIAASENYHPELFDVPMNNLLQIIDHGYRYRGGEGVVTVRKYNDRLDTINSNIILRMEYAFDKVTVLLIASNYKERLILLDGSGDKEEIVLPRYTVSRYFSELASSLGVVAG